MKLGSLFDGSGGFPLAGSLCGIEPKWAAEVEPYPIAVTRSRFPSMKHLGDISKINGAEVEPVDIITFGSPCQDLSVAGKRAGLKHEANGDDETTRSGLFMEAVRIIKEMRRATNGKYPSFALWENVPGAFSSNKGEDFRIVCEELIKIVEPSASMPSVPKNGWPYADSYCGDGWSLAYRVFDAQYWGVPQRRRRIHLVLDLRGERAREVLFEREGVRGYFETGRTPWEGLARYAQDCTGADDRAGEGFDGYNGDITGAVSATLGVNCGMSTGRNGVIECRGGLDAVAYSFDSLASNSMKSKNPHSGCRQVEIAKTLDTTDPNPSKNQGGIAIVEPVPYTLKIRSGCEGGGKGALIQKDKSATLATNNDQYLFQPVTLEPGIAAREGGHIYEAVSGTLRANAGDNQMAVAYAENLVLDDQGGSQITVRTDGKSPTLRAEMHGNVPCVLEAAGFKELNSAKARSDGYEDETAPTLSANKHDASVCIKCYDARGNGDGETVSTLTGDHENRITDYTSVVVEGTPVYCLQGNGIDRADTAGCNGKGWNDKTCYTLNTIDRPAVAYSIGNGQLNQISMSETCNTLDCMHDKQAVLIAGPEKPTICSTFQNTGIGWWNESDIGATVRTPCGGDSTLANVCVEAHVVDCRNMNEYPELYPTLQAKPNGGQPLNFSGAVRARYIVRRLTPTECARLQGFADRWGDIAEKTELSDEEYRFWLGVRKAHASIFKKIFKKYTKEQMLKWYNSLHTDSAEYKMWGNGIALPPALYCMQGIVDALTKEVGDDWML